MKQNNNGMQNIRLLKFHRYSLQNVYQCKCVITIFLLFHENWFYLGNYRIHNQNYDLLLIITGKHATQQNSLQLLSEMTTCTSYF